MELSLEHVKATPRGAYEVGYSTVAQVTNLKTAPELRDFSISFNQLAKKIYNLAK